MGLHIRPGDDKALEWYSEYFGILVGATITGFEWAKDEDFQQYWPTFTIKLANGDTVSVELSQDEEGNGPGWLFGLPMPAPIGGAA